MLFSYLFFFLLYFLSKENCYYIAERDEKYIYVAYHCIHKFCMYRLKTLHNVCPQNRKVSYKCFIHVSGDASPLNIQFSKYSFLTIFLVAWSLQLENIRLYKWQFESNLWEYMIIRPSCRKKIVYQREIFFSFLLFDTYGGVNSITHHLMSRIYVENGERRILILFSICLH